MASKLCPDIEPVLPVDLFGESPDTRSIAIMREFAPEEGYYLAFSGGKDSVVLYDLAVRSGVQFEAHYNLTTIDPPELVQFIKREYGGKPLGISTVEGPFVEIDKPEHSFWWYIRNRYGLPFRNARWCCEVLKERGGEARRCLVGVRAQESSKRAAYGTVRQCNKANSKGKVLVSPILHWTTDDIWGYIHARKIPYCSLYDEGWKRIGCILCPFNSQDETDRAVARWPKLFAGLLRAMEEVYDTQKSWQKFGSAKNVLEYWLDRKRSYPSEDDEQMTFDQFGEDAEVTSEATGSSPTASAPL